MWKRITSSASYTSSLYKLTFEDKWNSASYNFAAFWLHWRTLPLSHILRKVGLFFLVIMHPSYNGSVPFSLSWVQMLSFLSFPIEFEPRRVASIEISRKKRKKTSGTRVPFHWPGVCFTFCIDLVKVSLEVPLKVCLLSTSSQTSFITWTLPVSVQIVFKTAASVGLPV